MKILNFLIMIHPRHLLKLRMHFKFIKKLINYRKILIILNINNNK